MDYSFEKKDTDDCLNNVKGFSGYPNRAEF